MWFIIARMIILDLIFISLTQLKYQLIVFLYGGLHFGLRLRLMEENVECLDSRGLIPWRAMFTYGRIDNN